MQLTYNGVGLHLLGKRVQVLGQQRTGEPAEAPERFVARVNFRVIFCEEDYHQNYAAQLALLAALNKTHGVLLWVNEETGATYLNQEVTIVSHDLPEDPNAIGEYRQEATFTVEYYELADAEGAGYGRVSYQRSGSGTALDLGQVTRWAEGLKNQFVSQEKRANCQGQVSVSGRYLLAGDLTMAERRSRLEEKRAVWLKEFTGRDGQLRYGAYFDQTVRIDEAQVEVDPKFEGLVWTVQAHYTRFPDEANYAVAEIVARLSEDLENGESMLALSGRIGAPDRTTALAKLGLVRTAVLATYGFTAGQCVKRDDEAKQASVSPAENIKSTTGAVMDDAPNSDDGAAQEISFIELSFAEEYRKKSASVLSARWTQSDREELKSGLLITTIAGQVLASGATAEAAYSAALARAQEIGKRNAGGGNKYQFLVSSQVQAEYREVLLPTASAKEMVRLEFSYEFQRRGSRLYIEVTTEVCKESAGAWVETVSGFAVARVQSDCEYAYETWVKGPYGARGLLNERTSVDKQWVGAGAGPVETGEVASNPVGLLGQAVRYSFAFTVHRERLAGEIAMGYRMVVRQDFTELVRRTTVEGRVVGPSLAAARAFLEAYVYLDSNTKTYYWGQGGAELGTSRLGSERGEEHLLAPNVSRTGRVDVGLELSFSEEFLSRITGDGAIIEASLSEEIVYSGTRWVTQDCPDGPSVVQNCGMTPGSRTVSGSVTAATEGVARAWMKRMQELPFRGTAPGVRYLEAPRVQTSWVWLPRMADPIPRSGSYEGEGKEENHRFCTVGFGFGEVLPEYREEF